MKNKIHCEEYTYWMDGFWKVIAGFLRKNHINIETRTLHTVGRHELSAEKGKLWVHVSQPEDPEKWNRAHTGADFITVEVEEAPCTVQWFDI